MQRAILAGHIRGLMAPQPTDVSSSDRHVVKPWLNTRTPQAPRVVDLTQDGFPLVGGRIDVVGRVVVPTLVYRHRQHLISLTAVPGVMSPTERRTDIAYVPALVAANPGWRGVYDQDGALAETTCRRLLDRVIADKMMISGYHFPFPGAGTIAKDGTGYALTVMRS